MRPRISLSFVLLWLVILATPSLAQPDGIPNTTDGEGPSSWTVEELGDALVVQGFGAQGPQGIQGPPGQDGEPGIPGADEVSFSEITLCAGTSSQVCMTWTNKSASYVEVTASAARTNLDLSVFTEFRVLTLWSAAAVTGDFQIHCDADAAFGSQALLYQLDNPGAALVVGQWTSVPANECDAVGGVYLRAGMTAGNTTEDPAVRFVRLQVR